MNKEAAWPFNKQEEIPAEIPAEQPFMPEKKGPAGKLPDPVASIYNEDDAGDVCEQNWNVDDQNKKEEEEKERKKHDGYIN